MGSTGRSAFYYRHGAWSQMRIEVSSVMVPSNDRDAEGLDSFILAAFAFDGELRLKSPRQVRHLPCSTILAANCGIDSSAGWAIADTTSDPSSGDERRECSHRKWQGGDADGEGREHNTSEKGPQQGATRLNGDKNKSMNDSQMGCNSGTEDTAARPETTAKDGYEIRVCAGSDLVAAGLGSDCDRGSYRRHLSQHVGTHPATTEMSTLSMKVFFWRHLAASRYFGFWRNRKYLYIVWH